MIFKILIAEIDSMIARDPAARSRLDVVLSYPCFHALMLYRLANRLWRADWRVLARWVSHLGRFLTGIEIHPGATIGRRFFIDHGMGVVIGEMSIIGDDVTLYHGVTLGGIAPSVDSQDQIGRKRHPTLENGVIIGSGAQVLGPVVVGEGARVGANAVVVRDVPPNVTVIGIPARIVAARKSTAGGRFRAYGMPDSDLPDPVVRAMDTLRGQVETLMARVAELEAKCAPKTPDLKDDVDDEPKTAKKALGGPRGL